MNDKTDEEIKVERAKIVDVCIKEYGEIEVIDSVFESAPHDVRPLWFLAKSLELLSTADIVFLLMVGKIIEGARLNMNVQCNMVLKLYAIKF